MQSNSLPSQSHIPHAHLLRNANFLLLWSGQTISTLGTSISTFALPLLALALTNSPAIAGLLTATHLLPYLLFSLPVGALIDRWDRKAVLISCDLVRWLALFSIPVAFLLGRLSLPQLYVVTFIEGTASMIFALTQLSALPRVVRKEHLPQANALNTISESSASLLGPGLGGLIIGLARTMLLGAILAYLIDSISYLVSAISLRLIRIPFQLERTTQTRLALHKEVAAGLHFLWQQRLLFILALLTMGLNLLTSPVNLAVIVLARNDLHLDVSTLGLLLSLGGLGGLIGGLLAPWLQRRMRFGLIMLALLGLWALSALIRGSAPSPLLLMIGIFLGTLLWPIYDVMVISYRLSLIPDELQGRVNSTFRWLTYSCDSLGAALGGWLLGIVGPRSLLLAIAIGLALTTLAAGCTRLRSSE